MHESYSASITLSWVPNNTNTLADTSGYMIYYGTESGNYTYPPIDAGNNTSHTINDLDEDEIYFFSLTAYASAGEESDFSSEVSTFNEFTGTAQIYSRVPKWNSCEIEEEPFSSVEVYLSFDFLLTQNNFIFEPEDTFLTCDAGTFVQYEDNIIEAECVKKGPLPGMIKIYTFKLEGFGNASLKDPISMSIDVFTTAIQKCHTIYY